MPEETKEAEVKESQRDDLTDPNSFPIPDKQEFIERALKLKGIIPGSEADEDSDTDAKDSPESEGASTKDDAAPEDRSTQEKGEEAKPEAEKADGKDDKTSVSDSDASKHRKPDAEERIQQLIKEKRELEERLNSKPDSTEAKETQEPTEPVLVPEPKAPEIERDKLRDLRRQWKQQQRQAEIDGETDKRFEAEDKIDLIDEELRKWDKYDLDKASWESKNTRAIEQWKSDHNRYNERLKTEIGDLFNGNGEDSPVIDKFKEIVQSKEMTPWVAFAKTRPDGDYFFARLAHLEHRASEADALAEKNKQLEEQVAKFSKSDSPLESEGAEDAAPTTKSGKQTQGDVLSEAKRRAKAIPYVMG